MNEAPDPFEALLSALRPREVSPGMRQRIADRLSDSPSQRAQRSLLIGLAGILAAFCLIAVLFRSGGGWAVKPEPIAIVPEPEPPLVAANPGFTLLAYEGALARSQEDFDVLLAQDAVVAQERNPERTRVWAFTQPNAALHPLLGDD